MIERANFGKATVIFTIIGLIAAFLISPIMDMGSLGFVLIVMLGLAAGILYEVKQSKKFKLRELPEDILELQKNESNLKENLIYEFKNIRILLDSNSATKDIDGTLAFTKDRLLFYTKASKITNNLKVYHRNIEFSIPFDIIDEILYDKSENITLGRALLLGNAAFLFKKKTYYLVIKFFDNVKMKKQFVIETGDSMNYTFLDKLNETRRVYASNKLEHEKHLEKEKTIAQQIRELSELKNDGLITEDEFNEKKKVLLERIS